MTTTADDAVGLDTWLRAVRLHQWLKNLLVAAPLVAAHRVAEPVAWLQLLLAFLSLSLCASAVYLFNDLLDLEEDRRHPDKRQRPLAAGTLPSARARIAIPLLLLASLALGMLLPVSFLYSMLAYLTLAAAYTLLFRGLAVVDVLVLAVLFVLRITAGAGAVSVPPSPWLLVFCLFLFLNLALLKRYTELRGLLARGDQVSRVRGYSAQDLPLLKRFGFCSGLAAVLVLALYTTSDWVHTLYSRPVLLWLLCPLLVHMLVRLWQRARRDELHEDPVVFVITDRPGQLLAAVGVILLWLAS